MSSIILFSSLIIILELHSIIIHTCLCNSVLIIYASVLYLFMQLHCLCIITILIRSSTILIYTAVFYLFMQQYYTYLCSSIAYAAISTLLLQYLFMQQHYTYLRSSVILIYAAALLMHQYQLMQHLFTQHHPCVFNAAALLMQQYYTAVLYLSVLYLFYYNYSCSSNAYAAVLYQFMK